MPTVSHTAWDGARKVRFLDALAQKGDVRAAAGRVGMSRQSAYLLRRRDAVFAQGWAAALVLARAHVEEVLATRAIDGVEEAVWFRGELVGVRRRHDARLLLAHLARLDSKAEEATRGEPAGELAERFDELLALVAGAAPDASFFRASADERAPDPVMPLPREAFAHVSAKVACVLEQDEWELRKLELEDEGDWTGEAAGPEPDPDYYAYRDAFEAEWDTWQETAFAAADDALGLVAEEEPPMEFKSLSSPVGEVASRRDDGGKERPGATVAGAAPERARMGRIPSTIRCADGPPPRSGEDGLTFPWTVSPVSSNARPAPRPALRRHRFISATTGAGTLGPVRGYGCEGRRGPPPPPPKVAPADTFFPDISVIWR